MWLTCPHVVNVCRVQALLHFVVLWCRLCSCTYQIQWLWQRWQWHQLTEWSQWLLAAHGCQLVIVVFSAVIVRRDMKRLGVGVQTVSNCSQELKSGIGTIVITIDACLDMYIILKVSLFLWASNFNSMTCALHKPCCQAAFCRFDRNV